MNRVQLKQRIVGAIVLVALGVIFIPMILNHDDSPSGITGSNIPSKPPALAQLSQQPMPKPPAVPAQPAETRQLVDKDTPALPKATSPLTPATSAAEKPSSPSAASGNGKPAVPATVHGFVVQIASFTDRNKALRLRNRLRKAKYTCFVEAVTGKHGALYRVRVGPVVKREEAGRLQAKIARYLKLKGTLVMRYP